LSNAGGGNELHFGENRKENQGRLECRRFSGLVNLDEFGSQEWSNQKRQELLIHHQAFLRRMEYSVPRKERRIKCITMISMAVDVLMPFLIIHRKTIDDTIWENGGKIGTIFSSVPMTRLT
jgi:hypothetical protein